MLILIAGLLTFFAVHSVRIVAAPWRDAQAAANEGRWKGLYSVVSAIGLGLIIWGWVVYRPEAPQVFEPPVWGRYAAWGLVLAAFICLPAAYLPPGLIKATLRHPMVTAIILWALGHLLANGDLASLLLFGSFLVYGLVDRVAVIQRTGPVPAKLSSRSDLIAILVGAGAFGVMLWLHPLLFGVSPLG